MVTLAKRGGVVTRAGEETGPAALPPLRPPAWGYPVHLSALSGYPVSPGLSVFDTCRPETPGISQPAPSPNLTLAVNRPSLP